jgi:hypothetical protein
VELNGLRWHRPYQDTWRWVVGAFLAAVVVVLVWFAVGEGGLAGWLIVALGAVVVGYLVLVVRQGIYVSAHGVRVRMLLRSTTVAWTRIRGLDDHASGHRSDGMIGFRLDDGSILETPIQRFGAHVDLDAPILTRRQYVRLQARLLGLISGAGRPPGAHHVHWRQ